MVRAHVKQSDEEKKETRKKKTPAKSKKLSEAGVWPCKINGCNKQFAREADLKRHQRTTKSHSTPGFACPQCDATFTRTDALRRHQKSRHNGVIIEPIETHKNQEDGDNNEADSSASKQGSRSASPSAKGKGKGKGKIKKNSDTPTALANPGTAGPASGPSSYYRQHTMQNVFFSPQGMIMEAQQYAQNGLGLPTSATRLHQASWPPPPPWAAEGPQPQMGTISYHPGQQAGFYQPSPYYRQNGPMNGAPVMQQPFVSQNGMSPHQNATATQDNHASRTATPSMKTNPSSNQQGPDAEMQDSSSPQGTTERQPVPAAPVIDPSLDMSSTPTTSKTGTGQVGNAGANMQAGQGSTSKPVSLEITQAAMEAVLQSAQRESSRASGTPDQGMVRNGSPANGHVNTQGSITISQQQVGGGAGAATQPSKGGDPVQLSIPVTTTMTAKSPFAHQSPVQQPQSLPQAGERPEPMEQMLTEDGEPMLNPAELLTQESLASPPPS